MSVEVLTFGCRLNAAESEAMRNLAERAGHRGAVLVNTCAVTAEAEKQARKAVRAAHRRNPAAPILVTGCAAQIAPERWASLPGVARVVPNPDKLRPESWALAAVAPPGAVAPPATLPPLDRLVAPAAAPPGAASPAPPLDGAAPLPPRLATPAAAPLGGAAATILPLDSAVGPEIAVAPAAALPLPTDRSAASTAAGPLVAAPPAAPPPSLDRSAAAPPVAAPRADTPPPSARIAAPAAATPPTPDRAAEASAGPHPPNRAAAPPPPRATAPTAYAAPPRPGAAPGAAQVPPPRRRAAAPAAVAAADPGSGRTRAFLQVQGGCDHACTFCIIPKGRGPSFSVPPDDLAHRLRALVEAGHKEAVLTGVDLASYGADLPGRPTLGAAVRRLLALVPDLPRLRLSSLDPAALDNDLWRLLAEEPRLMPHLHLSLQHGADLVLKRMKRRHRRADALAAARRARDARPDIALGADLIAGFPTETEAHHRDTLALVEEMDLSFLHVFPYSERPGTPAARMPPVPVPLRRERAARLREAGAAAAARFYAGRIGREETVLFEAGSRGHTEHFAPLRLAEENAAAPVPHGALRRVRVTAATADGLLAAAAEEAR